MRLREGLRLDALTAIGRDVAARAVADGLAEQTSYAEGRLVLTVGGRLLADRLVRDLVD